VINYIIDLLGKNRIVKDKIKHNKNPKIEMAIPEV